MASTTGDFTVVATPGDQVPYALAGPDGELVEPVQDYLAELLAADCSPLTLRSYAFDLLGWFRFLAAAGVGWQHATRADVRDWVLGLRSRPDPQRARRGRDRAPSGASSTATGKPSERPSYAPATINHRLSVVAGFYQHHARLGNGPATNPVPDARPTWLLAPRRSSAASTPTSRPPRPPAARAPRRGGPTSPATSTCSSAGPNDRRPHRGPPQPRRARADAGRGQRRLGPGRQRAATPPPRPWPAAGLARRRRGVELASPLGAARRAHRLASGRRRMALGDCYRPYGSDCPHEHACVRCPMLRMDPAQLPRLLQIEHDTHRLLAEAQEKGWEGEAAGLEETLHHIADKKTQAHRVQESRVGSTTPVWLTLSPTPS